MCIYCGAAGPSALNYFRDSSEYRCNMCGKVFKKATLQQLTNTNHRWIPFDKRNPPASEDEVRKEVINAGSI